VTAKAKDQASALVTAKDQESALVMAMDREWGSVWGPAHHRLR
jgi:hypothetical protein